MTAEWLRVVEGALDRAGQPCPFFFRDDDAGWDDRALALLLDGFERRGVAVDVAVIPMALTDSLADELVGRHHGGRVRLHQHGFRHVNHEPVGRKCEFGPARTRAQQADDVVAGGARLRDLLGGAVDSIFTPPWNRCTSDTAEAIAGAGLRVLSRDASAGRVSHAALVEIPVTIDWFGHDKGQRWPRSELARRLAAGIGAGGPVGVMLHHAVTDETERRALDELLAVVAAHPNARPTTIATLALD